MPPMTWAVPIAAAFTLAATIAATGQDFASLYSSTAPRNCKQIDAAKDGEGEWSVRLCAGIGGQVVLVSEDDLRVTVSIGPDRNAAGEELASKQGFSPFNNVHDTLEWRMTQGRPFATIHRWFLSDSANPSADGRPTQVAMLVVTRLNPACHVAYVDVHSNAIANAMARKAADEHARNFDCSKPPMVIGKSGRAIELAKR
jgi:FlaG/FlaF family flagellin (archaellin)